MQIIKNTFFIFSRYSYNEFEIEIHILMIIIHIRIHMYSIVKKILFAQVNQNCIVKHFKLKSPAKIIVTYILALCAAEPSCIILLKRLNNLSSIYGIHAHFYVRNCFIVCAFSKYIIWIRALRRRHHFQYTITTSRAHVRLLY